MVRPLSLVFALALLATAPSPVTAHGYYGGGWRGPGWGHAWGYAGPGWRHGWARPYGAYGGYYGDSCWRWIDGAQVWVC